MDTVIDISHLTGWLPIRLYWQETKPMVDWCYLGKQRFTDPFLNQTVDACLTRPFNMLFRHQTSMEMLGQWNDFSPGLPPTGFIFHMSRCGSTLISQMLAAHFDNLVISEAPTIDSIIRARFRSAEATEEQCIEWLRWIVSALGQPRTGTEKHLFIKFDAWHILDLPLIRRAFPQVPWVFLYRDPVEVLVSQLEHRGAHLIPGVIEPDIFGIDLNTAITLRPEEYCARILALICHAGLQYHGQGGMLVNYKQLPGVVTSSLLELFRVSYTDVEIDSMLNAARLDAKNPFMPFTNDGEKKKRKATEIVREVVEKWLYPAYELLEAARQAQA